MDNVLVIEDNTTLRETIATMLELSGFNVHSASDGYAGLNLAIEQAPDLVICDVNMPVLDGYETIRKFRETSNLKFIPFIFLSALSTKFDIRKGMNSGAEDYLTKPFDPQELIAVVSRQLEHNKERNLAYLNDLNTQIHRIAEQIESNYRKDKEELESSFKSAQHIQRLILPTKEELSHIFPGNFIFYQSKDEISGDFFWARELGDIKLIAVADCTGHGIPGALLTMLYYQILNSIVDFYKLISPSEILTKANELITNLRSVHSDFTEHNGMDIVICSINNKTSELKYSGAQRPLYFVTNNRLLDEIPELPELRSHAKTLFNFRGDHYSIGNADPKFFIEERTIYFEKGDSIYLSSDGLADQFGGNHQKKFRSAQLKKLILSMQDQPIHLQEKVVEESFELWKGDEVATDDVTLIGIQL